jgi:hypothetical protein
MHFSASSSKVLACAALGLALAACSGGAGTGNGMTPSPNDAAPAATSMTSILPDSGSASSGGPTYDGCPVFPPGDSAYNQNISTTAVDPNSSSYIKSLGSNSSWSNDTSEYLNTATGSTPLLSVHPDVSYHIEPSEPWISSYKIEPFSDAHSFVLDTATCHIYELYDTKYLGSALSAYSGGNWNLRDAFAPYPAGQATAVASGDSMFAGAVKYSELASGSVKHALFLIVPYNMLAEYNFVRPASSTDAIPYKGPGPLPMPYGAKLRLVSNYPTTGLGTQALAVVRALQTYGAIVSDTGCCYKFVYMNDLSTANAFNYQDLNKLNAIKPYDWQVVQLPTVQSTH